MIRLDLTVGELKASTLFHVIDVKTSYHLLLGRPWLHENGVIPSTFHQSLKYIRNGEILKVDAETKPFTNAKSYFADAKLYLDPNSVRKVLSLKISSNHPIKEKCLELTKLTITETNKKVEPKRSSQNNASQNQPQTLKTDDRQIMQKELIMPITSIKAPNRIKPSFEEVTHEEFKGAFDPKIYKLPEKSDFDFTNSLSLGKLQPELTGEKIYGLSEEQQRLRQQGFQVEQPKVGLGFTPAEPVKIRITKKDKYSNVQHITAENAARSSVFERLGTLNHTLPFLQKISMSHVDVPCSLVLGLIRPDNK
ncbi:hypothetical protein CDL12_16069 [Handroanthus impetiginosus]|uniref:Uncharacterized protein n=1 Tax=Handroanthus impetiginosus TaxID=429701 RepID=A0A2G9H1E1_9LAMI|nr:hypothetical protein CDL12_16069 [Handroanthus impetiginosus]